MIWKYKNNQKAKPESLDAVERERERELPSKKREEIPNKYISKDSYTSSSNSYIFSVFNFAQL